MNPLRLTLPAMLVALLLPACSRSPAARFYILTPVVPQQSPQIASASAAQLWIRVLPVRIPDYLDRPQIVTLVGPNAIKAAEFDRWAGSLSENMAAVVAEDLGRMLGSERVVSGGAPAASKVDFKVALQVIRLDPVPGDHLLMEVRWALVQRGREDAVQHLATFTEPLADRRYESVVAAVSRTLAHISSAIAAEISLQANAAPAVGAGR